MLQDAGIIHTMSKFKFYLRNVDSYPHNLKIPQNCMKNDSEIQHKFYNLRYFLIKKSRWKWVAKTIRTTIDCLVYLGGNIFYFEIEAECFFWRTKTAIFTSSKIWQNKKIRSLIIKCSHLIKEKKYSNALPPRIYNRFLRSKNKKIFSNYNLL